jgi:hypothetical protein
MGYVWEGGKEGRKEGRREGGREGGREGLASVSSFYFHLTSTLTTTTTSPSLPPSPLHHQQMNFVNQEGQPTMPELLWPRGYLFFWCMAATLFSISLYFFRTHLLK